MKNDSGGFFVDTNVLVYAALKDDPRNEPIASDHVPSAF
jgi:hypothetical protein